LHSFIVILFALRHGSLTCFAQTLGLKNGRQNGRHFNAEDQQRKTCFRDNLFFWEAFKSSPLIPFRIRGLYSE
jgi:hypothetical protein